MKKQKQKQEIKKFQKATYIEAEKRRQQIEKMLLVGASYSQIVEYCSKNFNITSKQVDKYIAQIKDKWKKIFDKQSEYNLSLALARREFLYARALQENDIRAALDIERDIRKLQGLYIEKIEGKQEMIIEIIKKITDGEYIRKKQDKEEG